MWHHSKKIHSSFSCAKVAQFFFHRSFFFCTFSCHVVSTGSMWEVDFVALFLLCQNLYEIIGQCLNYILILFYVLCCSITLLTAGLIQKSTHESSKAVIWIYTGQISVARVLPSMDLGSWRETEGRQCYSH